MTLSAIVALTENNVIGKDGAMPWRLPNDLKFFKQTTMGKTIIMGRKTFDSIGKALPGRRTMVVTRQTDWSAANVETAASLEKALEKTQNEDEVFIVGGGEIFAKVFQENWINKIYISRIHATIDGDAYFPNINFNQWKKIYSEFFPKDEKHSHDFTLEVYEKA